MRVKFYVSRGTAREVKHQANVISSVMLDSLKNFGDDFTIGHNALFDGVEEDIDVACVWGVVGNAKDIVSSYVERGKHVIMFDKALIRHLGEGGQGSFRVGIDGPSPIKYMMRIVRNFDRWESKRIDLRPKIGEINPIRKATLYCGSSQKYCDFYGLGDANDYAESIINQIRGVKQKLKMVYRPKPSWQGAREIYGTEMSGLNKTLHSELKFTELLVTHGSAAAVEAIVHGVPIITLGPCAAQFVAGREVSSKSLQEPYFPSNEARWQWLCALAYCQWNEEELRSGEAWGFIRNEISELDK